MISFGSYWLMILFNWANKLR